MKPLRYLIVTIAVLCATPAAIGIVDAWAWLVIGRKISWIEWGYLHPLTAGIFLIGAVILINVVALTLDNGKKR